MHRAAREDRAQAFHAYNTTREPGCARRRIQPCETILQGAFMPSSPLPGRDQALRRLVLGGAVVLALLAAAVVPPRAPAVAPTFPDLLTQADAATAIPPPPAPPAVPDVATPPAPPAPSADAPAADATPPDTTIKRDHHGIIIEKGDRKVRIEGLGADREYDSFEQFMRDAPWLAGMFFVATLTLFLVPLLIVVLLVWYKLRKNRQANETMLKLAERGVVPPPTAMDAVASGTAPAMAAAAEASANPAYNHALALRRKAVSSDLRKGVFLTAIGLALSLWSLLDDASVNSVGLVLLFLGLAYCLLWFFEDRNVPHGTPPAGSWRDG
jgi:hypothetical protein